MLIREKGGFCPLKAAALSEIKGGKHMKKLISLLAAGIIGMAALPLTASAQGNEAPTATGDVNQDGNIDAVDACQIIYYYGKVMNGDNVPEETKERMLKYGDVNSDGMADSADASEVLTIYSQNVNANMTKAEWQAYTDEILLNIEL